MSFLHNIRVGFFASQWGSRQLSIEECKLGITKFHATAPAELALDVCRDPGGNVDRGIVLAYSGGFPVTFKRGILTCPYLATKYQYSGIAFALFMRQITGCEIYSDDEGRFLTAEEIIPTLPLSDVFHKFLIRLHQRTDVS